jgi:porin
MKLHPSALAALLTLASSLPMQAAEGGSSGPETATGRDAAAQTGLADATVPASIPNTGNTAESQVAMPAAPVSTEAAPAPTNGSKATSANCDRSYALNLGVLKALKRPPTNNPLDSHTYIAGVRCQEKGLLKQDFLLQSDSLTKNLQNKGVEMNFAYFPDVSWSSFTQPGFSAFYLTSVDVYTEKTGFLWKGGQFHVTTAGWMGDNYSGDTPINHSIRAEEVPPSDQWRLFELWYGQKLSKTVELRLGKIYPWVNIASHQTSGIFQSTAFDYPGVYGSTTFTGNFLPYAVPPLGAQLIYIPNSHHRITLFAGDGKDDPSGGYGFKLKDLSLNADDGVEFIAEYAYLDHSPDPNKLPGYYKIGFQGNTGKFFDFSSKTMTKGNYGGYATVEKMIYAEPGTTIPRSQGALAFLKANVTPSPSNIVGFNASAGLTYAGLIPGRDRDMAGLGVAYTAFNADAAKYYASPPNAASPGLVASTAETVLEAVYLAQLTPWLMLIGSYQYIINPSNFGARDPATPSGHVVMLNTRLSF